MTPDEIKELAKAAAMKAAPTEYGMFDVRLRARTFVKECFNKGLLVVVGESDDMYQDIVKRFKLDDE